MMAYVAEADDKGRLMVPPELRDIVRPHSRYLVEIQGDLLILRVHSAINSHPESLIVHNR
jgi:DNA-binding transcriptional regulator/RsmH inhibitor MraZ